MTDTDADPLLCVIGWWRSGTIWATRLIAQAINSPSQTRYSKIPFRYKRDPVVWGEGRPGGIIRRLHKWSHGYQYQSPVVLVVRDPRAVAVSHTYFRGHEKEKGAFDAHFRWTVGNTVGNWVMYYQAWVKNDKVAAIVRYEDILDNPQVELCTIVEKLVSQGVPIHHTPSSSDIATAVKDNVFDVMENHAKRKGIRDDWKGCLSRDVQLWWEVEREKHEIVRRLGYG